MALNRCTGGAAALSLLFVSACVKLDDHPAQEATPQQVLHTAVKAWDLCRHLGQC